MSNSGASGADIYSSVCPKCDPTKIYKDKPKIPERNLIARLFTLVCNQFLGNLK
jgi:hypothetical protein